MKKNNEIYVMTDIDYWLWLSLKNSMTAGKMQSLFAYFSSPRQIYDMKKDELLKIKGLTRRTALSLADKSLERVFDVKKRCRAYNIKILTFNSPYYPENLRRIAAPPYVLYVRSSKNINLNEYIRIAMVGNRESTDYGNKAAYSFAYNLAQNDIVIVSGMAKGIDAKAHKGAIDAGGITVAVAGCGLHMAYPSENKYLMEKIIETGMVISEYPPGTKPDSWRFPERNRIISGLSQGVLVVEAPKRSGSLITANYALAQDKDLFAIPGDINISRSEGTNNLLKEYAYPATSAKDIFEHYSSFENFEISTIRQLQKEKGITKIAEYKEEVIKEVKNTSVLRDKLTKGLSGDEKIIANALSDVPISFEKLMTSTEIPQDKLTAMITLLEIKGIVKTHAGKKFTLNI